MVTRFLSIVMCSSVCAVSSLAHSPVLGTEDGQKKLFRQAAQVNLLSLVPEGLKREQNSLNLPGLAGSTQREQGAIFLRRVDLLILCRGARDAGYGPFDSPKTPGPAETFPDSASDIFAVLGIENPKH